MILQSVVYDPIAPGLIAWAAMNGVYIVCLIVGGGLLVVSTLFGGDADADLGGDFDVDAGGADVDVDVDGDVSGDADVGHGHDGGHGLSLSNWFSVQFLVYFVATFGLVGTTLSYLTAASAWSALGWSVLGGVVMGQAAHQLIRYLRRTSSNSAASVGDFERRVGRVTVAFSDKRRGEIVVEVKGRQRYVPAVAKRDDDAFSIGDAVGIVAFRGGTAQVVSQKEFEFITDA